MDRTLAYALTTAVCALGMIFTFAAVAVLS